MTAFKVVIPARFASTRLPGKPLLDIAGQPMIARVCERALQAHAEEVVVATDDQRIFDVVAALGIDVVMTDPDHQSGTERLAEVARIKQWSDDTVVVNVQGDEPLIPPDYIRDLAHTLANQQQAGIATLAAAIETLDEVLNPNAVKVVLDRAGYALYFSRAAIPWQRGSYPQSFPEDSRVAPLRHIGMYAYRVVFLHQYCEWPASGLEQVESLEQLRILWQGEKIAVKVVASAPEAGVDTPEDLQRVINRLSAQA